MILAALLAAAAPQPADLKIFTDWTVGCDNGRACHAVGLVPESWPENAGTMSVRRGGQLRVGNAAGATIATVSLGGATAAILYMDEQQRRLGTGTALARRGARPASVVPPPPPLPIVTAARTTSSPPL